MNCWFLMLQSPPVIADPEYPVSLATVIERHRLLERFDGSWRVLQLEAPAGFGKTTLVSQWATTTSIPVDWLTLTSEHNDVCRLQTDLARLDWSGSRAAVVVLDDAHLLVDLDGWDLLHRLAGRHRLVLLHRGPLRTSFLRQLTHGWVDVIDADALRFTLNETYTLLETTLQTCMTREQVRSLWAMTRGMPVGLVLAHVAERSFVDATMFDVCHWHRWDRLLDEYFREEMLRPLPDDLQAHILDLADLPYLSLDLGIEGLGDDVLRRLRDQVSFLQEDEKDQGRFRFEPLLHASLRRLASQRAIVPQPDPGRSAVVERLLVQGRVRSAMDLALRLRQPELTQRVLRALGRRLFAEGHLGELLTWLDRLAPDSTPFDDVDFDFWWIATRLALGRTLGVAERLHRLETTLQGPSASLGYGRLPLAQGLLAYVEGDGETAIARLRVARETLPASAETERLLVETYEGRQHVRHGDDHLAAEPLVAAEQMLRRMPITCRWGWQTVASDRANTYALRGDLHSAATKYCLMLAEMPEPMPDVEGFLRCRLLAVQLEQGDLLEAEQNFARIDELLGADVYRWRDAQGAARIHAMLINHQRVDAAEWRHDAALARIRLLVAQGDVDQAERWGAGYLKLVRHHPAKEQIVLMLAYRWLDRGEWSMVESWLRDVGRPRWPWVSTFGDINARLLAIDLDLARGAIASAHQQATTFTSDAAAHLRWSEYVAGAVRLALVRNLVGDGTGAREALAEAARVGIAGGFRQSFQVPRWNVADRFGETWSGLGLPLPPLPVVVTANLTQREMEVLELVAVGRSNKEIATRLEISANTVRNHLVRISRRLDAGSRTEVVARARERGLLN